MHVGADDLGDAASQKVPYHDSPVVTPHGEQRPLSVIGACDGNADTVKGSIKILRKQRKQKLRLALVNFVTLSEWKQS